MTRPSASPRRRSALWRAAVGVLAVGGAAALPAAGASAAVTAAGLTAPAAASAVIRTHAALVGESTPDPAAAPTASVGAGRRQLPVLHPSSGGPAVRAMGAATLPHAASAAAGTGAPLHNFDGVSALDNKAAAGFDLEPPDEGLGAGNGYVVNFVNVTGQVQGTAGALLVKPFSLNTFFHEQAAANTSDPRVFFDAGSGRWIASILGYSFDSRTGLVAESHVDIATSRTGDPRGAWRVVRFDTSNPDHTGCPCLADYPILGVDRDNVYVSTNEFDAKLTSFNGAQLYAISKRQLASGAAHPNMVLFQNLSVAGTLGYHVQPANTYGAPGVEYLMSSLDPNATYDNRIAVWALTDPAAVTAGATPTLSVRVVSSEAYAAPPNAQTQPGTCTGTLCGKTGAPTSGVVAADFDAMQEVQYIDGQLVGALDTAVNIAGDPSSRAGVAWFVVHPDLADGRVSAGTHVQRQGYLARHGQYLLYPHLNMTPNGAMALTFGVGGPQTYLSAGYATAPAGKPFTDIKLAAAGTTADHGFTGTKKFGGVARWGDYSNGQIIPGTNKLWLATQYIPDTGDGNANWGNRILELDLH